MTHTITDGIHEGRLVVINPRDKPKGFSYVTDDAGQAFYCRTRYLEALPEAKATKPKPAAETEDEATDYTADGYAQNPE